jgi:hypothetical protein
MSIVTVQDFNNKYEQLNKDFQTNQEIDFNLINQLIAEIKLIMNNQPIDGKQLGPVLGKLFCLKKEAIIWKAKIENSKKNEIPLPKANKESFWVKVGNGKLKIGHKPGRKIAFPFLKEEGTKLVITILSEKEGALQIREEVLKLDIDWLWIPLADGKLPNKLMNSNILEVFLEAAERLKEGQGIYIHCAAGLHRTGMITNAFLRFLGYDAQASLSIIRQLRELTAVEVRAHRLAWGEQFARSEK